MITIQNTSDSLLIVSRGGTNEFRLTPSATVTFEGNTVYLIWTNGATATVAHGSVYARAVAGVPGVVDVQSWDWVWLVPLTLWGLLMCQQMITRIFTRVFGAPSDNMTE